MKSVQECINKRPKAIDLNIFGHGNESSLVQASKCKRVDQLIDKAAIKNKKCIFFFVAAISKTELMIIVRK